MTVAASVQAFLQEAVGDQLGDVSNVLKIGAGESAQTWRFTASADGRSRDLIARWYTSQPWAFGDLAREDLTRRAAEKAGVPVAHGWGVHEAQLDGEDCKVLITEVVPGDVPSPWKKSDSTQMRGVRCSGDLLEDFVAALVAIHEAAVPEAVKEADLRIGATMVERELTLARTQFALVGLSNDPVLTYAQCWIEQQSRSLSVREDQLVHCDYRLGNLVLEGSRVVAVLDWEGAQGGDGMYDLGWLVAPVGHVDGLAGGLAPAAELLEAYARHKPDVRFESLQMMAALAGLRNVASWAQLAHSTSGKDDRTAAQRLRKFVNALRVRETVLQPILDGPTFYEAVEEPGDAPAREGLAAVASLGRARSGSSGRANDMSAALSLLGSLSRRSTDWSAYELSRKTQRFLHDRGWPSLDSSPEVGLSEYLRTRAADGSTHLFGASGPESLAVAELLRQWSRFPAGWLLGDARTSVGL